MSSLETVSRQQGMSKSQKKARFQKFDASENLYPYEMRDLWGRVTLEAIRCFPLDDLPSVRRSRLHPPHRVDAAAPKAGKPTSTPGGGTRSSSVPPSRLNSPRIEQQVVQTFSALASGIFPTASPEDKGNGSDNDEKKAERNALANKRAQSAISQRIRSRKKQPPDGIPTLVHTSMLSEAAAQADGTLSRCLGNLPAKVVAVELQGKSNERFLLSKQEFVTTVADCLANPPSYSPEVLEQRLKLHGSDELSEVRRWAMITFAKDLPWALDEAIAFAGQEALTPTQWWEFVVRNGWVRSQEVAMIPFREVGEHGLALAGDLLCEEVFRVRSWLIKKIGSRLEALHELGSDEVTEKRWITFMQRRGWKGGDDILKTVFQIFDTSLMGILPSARLIGDLKPSVDLMGISRPASEQRRPDGLETRLGQWLKHLMDDWTGKDPDRVLRWLLWTYEGEHAALRRDLLSAVVQRPVTGKSREAGRGQSAKKSSPVMENVPLRSWLSFVKQCESPFSTDVVTKFFTVRTSENNTNSVHVDKLLAPTQHSPRKLPS